MFRKVVMVNFGEGDLEPDYWQRIRALADEVVVLPIDSQNVAEHRASADCLLLKLGMAADRVTIDSAPNLRYLGMLGTGYGRVDAGYAASRGIVVTNVPGYSTDAVAELVFGVILEHLREIERAKRQAVAGNYSEVGFRGSEIHGKRFGVLGLGRIGGRVAEIAAHGFGAHTSYWSRRRKPGHEEQGIEYQEVDTLLATSQIVSIHLQYVPETRGFLNATRLKLLQPGAVVVNTAPMEVVDVDALEDRLEKNDLTFILDHAYELSADDAARLGGYPNCVIYPPIAYTTAEAATARQEIFVGNIESFLAGRPSHQVN